VHCFHHGVNCILADEMGLGKTLQTIAFLTHVTLGPEPRAGGPHLVIVPLSVLTSWVLEFRRFSPHLRVVRLHSGDEKERERLRREVLADVTGYDVVRETLRGASQTLAEKKLEK
jgi:SWI/SNF-related matrix-associated actin-dependent regulator of chromatin subfamily A member 5